MCMYVCSIHVQCKYNVLPCTPAKNVKTIYMTLAVNSMSVSIHNVHTMSMVWLICEQNVQAKFYDYWNNCCVILSSYQSIIYMYILITLSIRQRHVHVPCDRQHTFAMFSSMQVLSPQPLQSDLLQRKQQYH